MIPLALSQAADVVGGDLVDAASADRWIDDVTIDSRLARPGSLFIPLHGERVDGHDFVAHASRRGASGYLWDHRRPAPEHPGGILVDDPADALLGLGAWVRDRVDPAVIAITGSSGKTTTKDLIAAAVGAGRSTVANPGSYNNEIGVPLTCCRLSADTEVLVAEIGSRGLGHIARLAPLIAPDVAVVTTVGASHLAMLGDLDTVARAKSELVESLDADGIAVLNADDARVAAMADVAPGRVVTYGMQANADWRGEAIELDELARPVFTVRGRRLRLALPGEHNVGNALAALAAADAVGVDLDQAAGALEGATVSPWRMQLVRTADGLVILNDAYNANPASMTAALATLAHVTTGGRRWAVLGYMAELGPGSDEAHRQIGHSVARSGIERLLVVGSEAEGIRAGAAEARTDDNESVLTAEGPDEAIVLLRRLLRPDDAVLVKASRSVGLERIVDALAGHAS